MITYASNPHGGDIYSQDIHVDFSVNTNPFGTPASVQKAVEAAIPRLHTYPDPYCRKLIHGLSEHHGVAPENIICGNGAADIIFKYCLAVKPRRALVLAPTFAEYELALRSVGCEMLYFDLDESRNFDVPGNLINAIVDLHPDVVFLCNPNNPTGRVISPDILVSVADTCFRHNIRLFLDECFIELTESGVSLKDHLYIPQLFILRAFTKSFALAGIRLGYAMTSDKELLTKMGVLSQPWDVSVLAQAAGVAALRESDFLDYSRKVIRTERIWLTSILSPFFRVIPSESNYILFKGPTGLKDELLEDHILIRDCSNYKGLGEGWFRIAVKLHSENEILVKSLSEIFATK